MLAPELIDELKLIAFCDAAKPVNRVGACASLARNGIELDKVKTTLFTISTDITTPDAVKIRAIDLLDKLKIDVSPKELSSHEATQLAQDLMEQYVGTT